MGDTSVHAFTGEGQALTWHLLIVIGVLLAISVGLIAKRWKTMPKVKGEEATSSREFWMFIGSFVLLLSALQIIISTSIPVWSPLAEMITGKKIAPPVDPIEHYNSIQVWVAIIVGLLTGAILYLKFKATDMKTVAKRLSVLVGVSVLATVGIAIAGKITVVQYLLLLFVSCFAIVANIYYAFGIQKQLKKMGPPIAHLGFGLSLLGILISSYNKEVISLNTLGVQTALHAVVKPVHSIGEPVFGVGGAKRKIDKPQYIVSSRHRNRVAESVTEVVERNSIQAKG